MIAAKGIEFHPSDWKYMLNLMKRHKEFPTALFGKNEDGETILVSINEHNITIETYQSNEWIRENVYWDDFTVEELYHK